MDVPPHLRRSMTFANLNCYLYIIAGYYVTCVQLATFVCAEVGHANASMNLNSHSRTGVHYCTLLLNNLDATDAVMDCNRLSIIISLSLHLAFLLSEKVSCGFKSKIVSGFYQLSFVIFT